MPYDRAMRRTIAATMLALGMATACGGKSAAEEKAEAAKALAVARAAQARAEAEALAKAAALRTEVAATAAKLAVIEAAALGLRAKAELDKVYRSSSDYDLDVTTAAASTDHAAKLAALPHVTIGDVTVGYEQVAIVSATGVGRSRHFRCTWRRGERDVIVGYQTSEELDLVAFAALVEKLVPAVERVLP